jgi:hypothetical protein
LSKLLARSWLIVTVLSVAGLAGGLIAADMFNGGPTRVKAQATLTMMPGPDVPPENLPDFWEVLNQGQPTRSAAIILADSRWLRSAATTARVPQSELELAAGAIPETSLITVTMKAHSPGAAERALDSVLAQASTVAASSSGPYILETVSPPTGSARSIMPTPAQWHTGLGIGGFLVGAGLGLVITRRGQKPTANSGHFAMPQMGRPADSISSGGEPQLPPPASVEPRQR